MLFGWELGYFPLMTQSDPGRGFLPRTGTTPEPVLLAPFSKVEGILTDGTTNPSAQTLAPG